MKEPPVKSSVEICNIKETYLDIKAVVEMKRRALEKLECSEEKVLKSNLLDEADLLSYKALEQHDRVANCACFPERSHKENSGCQSPDVRDMKWHLELLQKLKGKVNASESRDADLPDNKPFVPRKPLNPLSKSFIPSAKVYKQMSAAKGIEGACAVANEIITEMNASEASQEMSRSQTNSSNENHPDTSNAVIGVTTVYYSLKSEIKGLWPETKHDAYFSNPIYIKMMYCLDQGAYITPGTFKTIWTATDEERKIWSRCKKTESCPNISYSLPQKIAKEPAKSRSTSEENLFMECDLAIKSVNESANEIEKQKDIAKIEIHKGEDKTTLAEAKNAEDISGPRELPETEKTFPRCSSPKGPHYPNRPDIPTVLAIPDRVTKWSDGSLVHGWGLNEIKTGPPKIEEAVSSSKPLNPPVCDHPCSNWCDTKQTKNITETSVEKTCKHLSILSRHKNTTGGKLYPNSCRIITKTESLPCIQQADSTVVAAKFVKQTSTIFDTDQWSTWKLAEIRLRRDSGDSGYNSIGQSEHDNKFQQCYVATENLFSSCNEDFSNSGFESEFWTPLPDCKPKMQKNLTNRHKSSLNWDSIRNLHRNGLNRGRNLQRNTYSNDLVQARVTSHQDMRKLPDQLASRGKIPYKRATEQKPPTK